MSLKNPRTIPEHYLNKCQESSRKMISGYVEEVRWSYQIFAFKLIKTPQTLCSVVQQKTKKH